MESPLLSLMGFQGPSNDSQLLDLAVGEWPPRWWKQLMGGQPERLPTTYVRAPLKENTARSIVESPYARDTLAALSGGGTPNEVIYRPNLGTRDGYPVYGTYQRSGDRLTLRRDATHETVEHEYGHRADRRNAIPGFDEIVARDFPKVTPDNSFYASRNRGEYSAELFQRSVDLIARSRTLEELDRNAGYMDISFPSIKEAVYTVLQQPIYQQHPLAVAQRRRLFARMGIHTPPVR